MKKYLKYLLPVLLLCLLTLPVLATDGAVMSITPSAQQASPGESITVTVSLSEVSNVTAVGLGISFDTNVFEMEDGSFEVLTANVKQSSFKYLANANGYVAQMQMEGAQNVSGALFSFRLKVKEGAQVGASATISGTPSLRANNAKLECALEEATFTVACSHQYGPWSNADGQSHKHSCTICGFEETAAHNWDEGVVTADPTCAAEGVRTHTCADCGATKTEAISPTGNHTYGGWTKADSEKHKHTCSVCGHEETESHHYDEGTVTKNPTCGEEGIRTFHCTDCSHEKTESIPTTEGHTYGEWTKVDGAKHKHKCTVCGREETASHHWDEGTVTKKPTCGAEGVRTYHCTDCGHEKTESIPTTEGHTYGDWVKVDSSKHKHTCSICGKEETDSHHFDGGTVTKKPTCTDEGVRTYTCGDCGATKTEAISATGKHTYGDWQKVDEAKHKRTCSVCGKEETKSHSFDDGKVTREPTCAEEGVRTYTCDDCGATKTEAISATGNHTYGNWSKVSDDDHKRTCSGCGKEETGSHNWNSGKVTRQPTCAQEGIRVFECQTCGCSRAENIEKTEDHEYSTEWSGNADAHWHRCMICGQHKDEEAHTPGAEATEWEPQVCTVCGYELHAKLDHVHQYEEVYSFDDWMHWYACACGGQLDAQDHVFDNDCDTLCDLCGYTRQIEHDYSIRLRFDETGHWHECTICGEVLEVMPHTPGPEATETTDQICMECGFIIQPAGNHEHTPNGDWLSDDAGHWHRCSCGENLQPEEHQWNEGLVDEDAGTIVYHCTQCGYPRVEQIPDEPEPTDPKPTQPQQPQQPTTPGQQNNPQPQDEGFPWWILIVVGCVVLLGGTMFLLIGILIGRRQTGKYV